MVSQQITHSMVAGCRFRRRYRPRLGQWQPDLQRLEAQVQPLGSLDRRCGRIAINASGDVYHVQDLKDFDGNYTTVSAGLTVVGGGSVAILRNEHGVVIKLHATTEGLRFNLAAEGVDIKLKS